MNIAAWYDLLERLYRLLLQLISPHVVSMSITSRMLLTLIFPTSLRFTCTVSVALRAPDLMAKHGHSVAQKNEDYLKISSA